MTLKLKGVGQQHPMPVEVEKICELAGNRAQRLPDEAPPSFPAPPSRLPMPKPASTAKLVKALPADSSSAPLPPPDNLALLMHFVRGEKVLLDADLATLYGVPAKVLNQAVQRNLARFPEDFMFRLSRKEAATLRSQIVTSKSEVHNNEPLTSNLDSKNSPLESQIVTTDPRGGARYLPYAFTEQGVAMLSSVLRSPRAVEVNIAIMRTFVQLRRLMDSNRDLAQKIEAMEQKYDEQFAEVFEAIRQLIARDHLPTEPPKPRIGFTS